MYISAKIARGRLIVKLTLALSFTLLIILFPETARQGVSDGVMLCFNLLIPALFPFFFILDYLYALLVPLLINKSRGLILLATFLFALVGGFPTGAKLLAGLVRDGVVKKRRAAFLLCGLVNAGPAYLISGVGLALFSSAKAGVLLFAALSLSSAVLFLLALFFAKDDAPCEEKKPVCNTADFSSSLSFAVGATARLCSFVTVFSVIIANIKLALAAFGITDTLPLWGICSLLEVTSACTLAAGATGGLYLCLVSVSLCGLSVISQASSFVKPCGISTVYLLISRPIHLLLSLGFMKLLCLLLPQIKPAFFVLNSNAVFLFSAAPFVSLFLFLTSLIFVAGTKEFSLFTN